MDLCATGGYPVVKTLLKYLFRDSPVVKTSLARGFGFRESGTFFLAVILLLSLGTILDDGKDGVTNFEKLLNAFSLKRNLRKVFDLSDSPTRVKGVDAYRGMNAFALLIAHKSMAMAHNPFVNKVSFSAHGDPWMSPLQTLINSCVTFYDLTIITFSYLDIGKNIERYRWSQNF